MITDSQAKAGPFVGDGMTTEYDFAFPALSADHIAVYVDEVKITSGYTAALLPGGGRVTLDDPLPEGARLAIVRDVPFEQVVDLQNNTAFLPEVIETALDRLTMICQQLRESLSRAVTMPPTDTGQTWDEIYLTLIQASADAATLKTELDKKVDKVAGKGLSTNDYDNTEKAKVAAAETEATLGIDTASGDTAKFLNQKKQWVVPAGGSGSGPAVELLSTLPTPSSGDVGRVALFTGASTGAYVQNKIYQVVMEDGPTYAWRPLLPPEQEFSTSPVDIQPGGKYRNTANAAFTFNIGGYVGCRDDAEVVFDAGTGASITAGPGLTLVDAIAAGKRNFCVIKFFGTTARLFVVHTEDL